MNLNKIKLNLPKTWSEASRMGGENQVVIRIYHINPLAHVDPKRLQDQPIPSENPEISITKVGIPTPGMRPLNDFYTSMKAAIASGLMPPEWTPQKLDKLWKGITKTPHGEQPGESDMANDIEIIQCPDEEYARQTLKNKALMPTHGFDIPIPGGITVPGLPKNMTMGDLLQSNVLKKYVPKEQFAQLEKMQSAIKGVQEKMPQVKQNFEKAGVKYQEGKYLGCEAVYFEFPNPNPPPKSSTPSDKASAGGSNATGLDPLPKVTLPYHANNSLYLGIIYKNFIIGGLLLSAATSLPPGNMPCYSLTQTKKITTITKEGGVTFKNIAIVPLVSNYAKEGYLHKEEVEEIYRNIISNLD